MWHCELVYIKYFPFVTEQNKLDVKHKNYVPQVFKVKYNPNKHTVCGEYSQKSVQGHFFLNFRFQTNSCSD